MNIFGRLFAWIGLVTLVSHVTAEVDPIVLKGSHFFYKTNGTAFFIRGILYRPTGLLSSTNSDPLVDGPTCRRDIPYLSSLNVNVILVNWADYAHDHSECMDAFSEAGIYVMASVSREGNGNGWDQQNLDYHTGIIDAVANFTNFLGIRTGTSYPQQPRDMLFYRAAIRDMRAYMVERGYRNIPIVFGAETEMIDFIDYMWCHDDTPDILAFWTRSRDTCFTEQDVDAAANFSRSFNMPNVWDKLTCETQSEDVDNRTFDPMPRLFSSKVAQTLSGAILDEYYTTVYYGNSTISLMEPDRTSQKENDVRPLPGYYALASALAKAEPSFANAEDYHFTGTKQQCPTGSAWSFSSVLPLKPYEPLCACMLNTLRCTAKLDAIETLSDDPFNITLTDACEDDWENNCVGIVTNTSTGRYGAFSACNRTTQYSWAANQYWKRYNRCDLNGTAKLRDEQPKSEGDCKSLLDQVGEMGERTLTAMLGTPTATTKSNDPQGTGGIALTKLNDSHGSGLSTGAKAGIGVGVPLFVIVCVIAGFWLLRRRGQSTTTAQTKQDLPEYVPPRSSVQQGQNGRNDLPEVQTLLRP